MGNKILVLFLCFSLMVSLIGCVETDIGDSNGNNTTALGSDEMYILILDTVRCTSDSNVAGDLIITMADGESELCTVSGKNAGHLTVDVDESQKTITVKGKKNISPESITIRVSANIREIKADKCKLNLDVDFGKTQDIALILKGTFYGNVEMEAETISADIKGSGDLNLSGTTKDVQIYLDGAAYLDTSMLLAEYADVTVKGTAICEVYASNTLNAELYGIGSITYLGNPNTVNKTIKGLGIIQSK